MQQDEVTCQDSRLKTQVHRDSCHYLRLRSWVITSSKPLSGKPHCEAVGGNGPSLHRVYRII
eukprot:5576176-Amphidinium_carterae.1